MSVTMTRAVRDDAPGHDVGRSRNTSARADHDGATAAGRRRRAIERHPSAATPRADGATVATASVPHLHDFTFDATLPASPAAAPVDQTRIGSARGAALRLVGDEDGSLIAEYGWLLVVSATVAMLAIKWATGGAIFELLGALLSKARSIVGA